MAQTSGIAHRFCAAGAEWRAAPGASVREVLPVRRSPIGRAYCRLTGHARMLARIT